MNCHGSVALLGKLELPPSDEHDYTREGSAMHFWAETCLADDSDAWELVDQEHGGVTCDGPMSLAIQRYLDYVRPLAREASSHHVEYFVECPDIHPLFYGKADFVAVYPDRLKVVDLKGGKGIIVEPDDNPQLKYYAFGTIFRLETNQCHAFPDSMEVELTIVQPRAWHPVAVIRSWRTTVGAIKAWVHDELVPHMLAAQTELDFQAGDWCRFCPAKLVCPLLTGLWKAAANYDPLLIVNQGDEALGRSYAQRAAVKHYLKALEEEALKRALNGRVLPGAKLVDKQADRVWKPGAVDLAKEQFGADKIMKPTEFKSPGAFEALGQEAAAFVREYAFTPQTGYTMAGMSDRRPAVKVDSVKAAFGDIVKAFEKSA